MLGGLPGIGFAVLAGLGAFFHQPFGGRLDAMAPGKRNLAPDKIRAGALGIAAGTGRALGATTPIASRVCVRSEAEPGLIGVDPDPGEVRGGVGGFKIGGAGDTGGTRCFLVGASPFLEPRGEALGSVGDGWPCLLSPGIGAQDRRAAPG
jgi:hypothetical protein